MIKAAAERGWIDERTAVMESLTCIKKGRCGSHRHVLCRGSRRVGA